MVLVLVFMQLTRDLFAIAKFLFTYTCSYCRARYCFKQADQHPVLFVFDKHLDGCFSHKYIYISLFTIIMVAQKGKKFTAKS